ncbi:hypothetical protein AGIG_G26034, partial [Arapaima gigas]
QKPSTLTPLRDKNMRLQTLFRINVVCFGADESDVVTLSCSSNGPQTFVKDFLRLLVRQSSVDVTDYPHRSAPAQALYKQTTCNI